MKNFCIDCKKEIGPYATRCGSCSATHRNLSGKGNFKGGKTLNKKCIDCGAPITKQAIRCKDCAKIILINRMEKLAESRKCNPLTILTEKTCRICHQTLPISEFYKHSSESTYYQADCKDCCKKIHAEYVATHRAQINAYNIEFNHRTGRSKMYGQGKKPKLNRPTKLGGKIYPPNWDERKKLIYERDNWTCQECGTKCHKPREIQCHHIDYNTDNSLSINLITLCRSCHAKTNKKRDIFQSYYKAKMLELIDKWYP